jgi:TrkA domain protein
VVAVIRGEQTIPSPPPDFSLHDGDTAVAVGTPDGVRRLFEMLQGPAGEPPAGG